MLPCSQREISNIWEISTWLPWPCCSHGVSVLCMCVQISSLFFFFFFAAMWSALPSCIQLILVSWYVASMLCCHGWMFGWSDALPMQSYPSKVWFRLLWPCRSLRGITYLFSFLPICFLHELGGISWLTLWRCWLHNCRMFIWLVEYDLVHRGDCINCETCYFCLIWLLYGRVLGAQTFTLFSL